MSLDTLYLVINVVIILFMTISCIISFKNGFLLQLISLFYTAICIFASWIISPILAKNFPLIKAYKIYEIFDISLIVNTIAYFVIVIIVLKLLYLVIKPLFKKVSKIPFLGSFNRIGGLIIGFVNASLICILVAFLINVSTLKNSKQIIDNTLLKYASPTYKTISKIVFDNVDPEILKDTFNGIETEKIRETLTDWLENKGIINE